jgi:heme-degrading monooxygenase HmoA
LISPDDQLHHNYSFYLITYRRQNQQEYADSDFIIIDSVADQAAARQNRGTPMIVTVFRTRMNPGVQDEYGPMARRMSELARAVPGYISHKGFVADDGERVTIVEFESEEALDQWRNDPEHRAAKKRGVDTFFSEFKFQICSVIRQRMWAAGAGARASK